MQEDEQMQKERLKMINERRHEAVTKHFKKNVNRRVFILTQAFPFMFIGKIKEVIEDIVVLDVETTSVAELEGKEWSIHIDSISVFYIETNIGPSIPELKG